MGVAVLLLAALAATAFAAQPADAELSCSVKTSCSSGEVAVYSMYSTDNSHACQGSLCAYRVCCHETDPDVTLTTDCADERSDVVLKLFDTTNAHVGSPFSSPSYPVSACLGSSVGEILCSVQSSCSASKCLGSISSLSNAHVGDCSAYSNKLCCEVNNDPPVVTDIMISGSRRYVAFTAAVNDPDGDAVKSVRYEVSYGSGWVDAGSSSDPSDGFRVVWDSYEDAGITNARTFSVRASAEDSIAWGDPRTESASVDNTPPDGWITAPSVGTRAGRIFSVYWDGNSYATSYEFQYVDVADFQAGIPWTSQSTGATSYDLDLSAAGHNADYCFRVRAVDDDYGIPGSWSCNPVPGEIMSEEGCTCVKLDMVSPHSQIETSPLYAKQKTFDVSWEGNDEDMGDEGSGVACYEVWYRIYDEKNGVPIAGWTDWEGIYDTSRNVWTGSACETVECTTLNLSTFDQDVVLTYPLDDQDSHTFYFSAKALDSAYGCGNIQGTSSESVPGTWIDWTAPPAVSVSAVGSDGDPLESPDGVLYVPDSARIYVSADPQDLDYTGIAQAGFTYWMMKAGAGGIVIGDPSGTTVNCAPGEHECSGEIGPWDNDYVIRYKSFAVDLAGNRGESEEKSFSILKPFKLTVSTNDLYMTLGSYKVIQLSLANRQNLAEDVVVRLSDYQYAKFVEDTEGELSEDLRTLRVSLGPREERTVHLMVYTQDTGDDYNLNIQANSERPGFEDKIEDSADIVIRVVFPHEFSGLGIPALVAAVLLALAAYAAFLRKD